MPIMSIKTWPWPKSPRRIAAPVAALMLAILAGCATQPDSINPSPEPEAAPEVAAVPSVSPLADGRQGFIITETARLNEASRRDFEAAVALLDDQSYEPAIELLQKVIEQSPGVTAPHINLGMAYQRTGKTEQAEAQFKAALQLIPGHPVACNQYGLLCRKTGRFEEARRIYEQALARFPEYYPLHRNLGILCDIYLDDLVSALVHYKAYSRARPEDEQVKLWIADLEARLGSN